MYYKSLSPIIAKFGYTPEDILTESSKGVDENILEHENSYACAIDKW